MTDATMDSQGKHFPEKPTPDNGERGSPLSYYRVQHLLEERIHALGPEFSRCQVMQRWYHYVQGGEGLCYFDWSDGADRHGMPIEKITRALSGISELKPVADSIDALRASGYTEGFPNPSNIQFFDPFRRDHLAELRDSHGFIPWCYALTLDDIGPQKTFLVVAKVQDGKHFNFLGYADCVHASLTRALKSQGMENPCLDANFNSGEEPIQFVACYSVPERAEAPSFGTWLKAILDIPGAVRCSKKTFRLNLQALPGLNFDGRYPQSAEIHLHSVSSTVRPKAFELAARDFLNGQIKDMNLGAGSVTLDSERGPVGPNYLSLYYGYYCQCESLEVLAVKLAQVRGLSKKDDHTYLLDSSQVPALATFPNKQIPLRLGCCTEGSWA